MTKSELIEAVSERIKLPKGKAELIVNCIFDSMVDALKKGEGIEIRGFGSFTVREYKPYEGRNPRTGQPVHVAPKRLPFFKVGKELRERVDQSRERYPIAGEGGQGRQVAVQGESAAAAAGNPAARGSSSSSSGQ